MGPLLTTFKSSVDFIGCVEMKHINLKRKIRKKGTQGFFTRLVRVLNSDPEAVTLISHRALGNSLHPTTIHLFLPP